IALKEGQAARAAGLLGKKAEVERLLTRYLKLHARNQPIRDAEVLAQLAGKLGRRFEERGFLTIAVAQEPGREDLKKMLRDFDRHATD
ncbi:MAG TPA: hypothetical protein VKA15_12420, partial [Isosphaeraceae bacterium]|nr:hypothetical protein [Isosphaeraceae bacterium]